MTSTDVRFWRIKTDPALEGLPDHVPQNKLQVFSGTVSVFLDYCSEHNSYFHNFHLLIPNVGLTLTRYINHGDQMISSF